MRTIKFRGKYIRGWHYGDLRHTEIMGMSYVGIINEDDKKESGSTIYIVPEETVGQFTGLFDKNGKEIYEGDIVNIWLLPFSSHEEKPLVVKWYENEGGFVLILDEETKSFNRFGDIMECEIIGNIYDNPELLKKRNE